MKVNKLKKIKKNQYEVEFNNGIKIKVYDDIIVKYNLLTKKEIDDDIYLKVIKENESSEAYYISLAYIKRRLRSEKEIISYLNQKEYNQLVINDTVDRLKKENYLNESNFIVAFIYDRVNLSNDGYYKIFKELKKHNINEDIILKHLDEIPKEVWIEKLEKLINKKTKHNSKYSINKLKQKISYDLTILGYEKDIIDKLLQDYSLNDNSILEKEYSKIKQKLSKKYNGKNLNYQIRNKLYQKGFTIDDINKLTNEDE